METRTSNKKGQKAAKEVVNKSTGKKATMKLIWAIYLSITHSWLYQRLSGVTQVITFPTNGNTRNRRTHTEDLRWLVLTVAGAIGLLVKLCVVIAVGHDIGHVPFGHDGEKQVRRWLRWEGFSHGWMGVRLLKIMGVWLHDWVKFGIEYHSDGDKLINKAVKYSIGKLWKKCCHLVAILDDVACAISDLTDIPREFSDLSKLKMKKAHRREMQEACRKARALLQKVLEHIGRPELINDIEEAHKAILQAFADDIIANTKEKNHQGIDGIFMSEKLKELFFEMKRFMYEEFHQTKYILSLRRICMRSLHVVMKETKVILEAHRGVQPKARKTKKSVLEIDIEFFLEKADYKGEEVEVNMQVVDFICTREDLEIIKYHQAITERMRRQKEKKIA